ncbi:MAG: glutathione peroxidase [Bacteroidetes bacterium MedPE-SWsnd-G1]|nr:MAG: glutathione peroxidase [Bacteroidetes bacterium MedPE-SWsnd-G1]
MNIKTNLYSIEINSLSNEKIDFNKFKGKKILIVNTASKCGFTKQYKGLQELHEKYGDKLVIIGVPCNQFASQEPGSANEIESFCEINYGVTFLLTEKIKVKGKDKHPLYKWLTDKELNGVKSSSVKWNFQKYLIDEEGNLIDVYYSITKPMSSKIVKNI